MDFLPETDQEETKTTDEGIKTGETGPADDGRKAEETSLAVIGRKAEETEEAPDFIEEIPEERPEHKSGFAAGFVTGLLAAVGCTVLFLFAVVVKQEGIPVQQEVQEIQEAGAGLLTDRETLGLLEDVQEIIDEEYLNEVDGEQLVSYLFKGIAAGLDDPYASYYTKEELQSVLDESRGAYFGIGATLMQNRVTGEICVTQVYEGNAAARAGLQTGDIVRSVDGVPAEGADLTDLVGLIKAAEAEFEMEIYRPGTEEELVLSMQCSEVVVKHVEYEMLEKNIGYIRLSEFSESAVGQFADAAADLKSQGMEKLIVDLRNNPGGLLNSVCDILDEILPGGLMVYTENRSGDRVEYEADEERTVDCEVAVLVNGYSASASEIFAGAVQDYGLGPVIGTTTYGKGVVQKTYPLSDGSAFKMTVEKYYTPAGQDIDGTGIVPDIVVEEPEAAGAEGTEDEKAAGPEDAEDGKAAGAEDTEDEKAVGVEGTEDEKAAGPEDAEDEKAAGPEGTEDGKTAGTQDTEEAEDPVLARAIEELSGEQAGKSAEDQKK